MRRKQGYSANVIVTRALNIPICYPSHVESYNYKKKFNHKKDWPSSTHIFLKQFKDPVHDQSEKLPGYRNHNQNILLK